MLKEKLLKLRFQKSKVLFFALFGLLSFVCGYSAQAETSNLETFQCENGKYGFKNTTTQEIVIECKYDDIKQFEDGFARVKIGGTGYYDDGKYGLIDATGKEIVEPKYDMIYDFSEGLAQVNIDGSWIWDDGDPHIS